MLTIQPLIFILSLRTFSVFLRSATKVHLSGGGRQSGTFQPLRSPELHSGLHRHRGEASTSGELDLFSSSLQLIFFMITFALFSEESDETVLERFIDIPILSMQSIICFSNANLSKDFVYLSIKGF